MADQRHGVYYAPGIVPCQCGSREPYWHGPEHGRRDYCCDACWRRLQEARGTRTAADVEDDRRGIDEDRDV